VQFTSFLPSVRELEFPLFDEETEALLQSQWGTLGVCVLQGEVLLVPAEWQSSTQWRNWDSSPWTGQT
jgi:hypothetical protein